MINWKKRIKMNLEMLAVFVVQHPEGDLKVAVETTFKEIIKVIKEQEEKK